MTWHEHAPFFRDMAEQVSRMGVRLAEAGACSTEAMMENEIFAQGYMQAIQDGLQRYGPNFTVAAFFVHDGQGYADLFIAALPPNVEAHDAKAHFNEQFEGRVLGLIAQHLSP